MRSIHQSMLICILIITGFSGLRFFIKQDRSIHTQAAQAEAQDPASSLTSKTVLIFKPQGAINGSHNEM